MDKMFMHADRRGKYQNPVLVCAESVVQVDCAHSLFYFGSQLGQTVVKVMEDYSSEQGMLAGTKNTEDTDICRGWLQYNEISVSDSKG